ESRATVKTRSSSQIVPKIGTARCKTKIAKRNAPTPKTMFGTACGKNAMKSKPSRPGTVERSTIHEKAMQQARVTVGVSAIRMAVLRSPSRVNSHGRLWNCAQDSEAKAAADGSWK